MKACARRDLRDGSLRLWFWCPACETNHAPRIERGGATGQGEPVWEWNRDVDTPTLRPSVSTAWTANGVPYRCHLFVREGRLEFCVDSTRLAGQVVVMEDWQN